MAQLEVPAALPEDLCLVTSTHIRHIKITYGVGDLAQW